MKCVIGLDFGTQSARAVLVSADTGAVLRTHSVSYSHGIMDGSLACASDYETALFELINVVASHEYRDIIVGICVDATSLSLVPVTSSGKALSALPEFFDSTHAQIKLWKRHTAQSQADEAVKLAHEHDEHFLRRTGGSISSEWMLPKLLETRDEDPAVYKRIDIAMDLCEFLTYRLTGRLIRSIGSMSFKGLWSPDLGFPSSTYLDALRPGFAKEYRWLMRGEVKRPGECAGFLLPDLCKRFGLRRNVAIAAGVLDGHTALAAVGSLKAGDATLVIGTSNVLTIQTEKLIELPDICGVALDGLTGGLYGIDAGQNCTGDMLEWYIRHALPKEYIEEARGLGISPHDLLIGKIKKPWTNEIVAADWWNGSRNAPCDLQLTGMIAGLTLRTRPEHIYLSLLQAIACGTRNIIEHCESHGIVIRRLLAAGGVANKNSLLMSQYAGILDRPIDVAKIDEGPALGAGIFAAVASGIYATPMQAYQRMGVKEFIRYIPDTSNRDAYERLYQKNYTMREMRIRLGKMEQK